MQKRTHTGKKNTPVLGQGPPAALTAGNPIIEKGRSHAEKQPSDSSRPVNSEDDVDNKVSLILPPDLPPEIIPLNLPLVTFPGSDERIADLEITMVSIVESLSQMSMNVNKINDTLNKNQTRICHQK